MKNKILLIFYLLLFSCTTNNLKLEYYPNGNLKSKMKINERGLIDGKYEEYHLDGTIKKKTKYADGVVSDTVYYFENEVLKKKGLLENGKKTGWWFYYDSSGKLSKKVEYLLIADKTFVNQEICYDTAGNIDYNLSSFFKLHINDTLPVGKSTGRIDYFSNSKNFDLQFVYIIIENEYADGTVRKDTFTDDISKLWFGVNAYKPGHLKIKGIIEEELAKEQIINRDSSELIISKKNKYFEKDVFVLK